MPNSLSLFTLFSRVSGEEIVDVNHTKTVSALFKKMHTRIAVVFKTKTEKMLHICFLHESCHDLLQLKF